MSTGKNKIKLFQAQAQNDSYIAAIARTVTAAFASDPLIQWLRPGTQLGTNPNIQRWQHRRVQSIMTNGMVFQSSTVSQMARENPRKEEARKSSQSSDSSFGKVAEVSLYEDQAKSTGVEDAGAAIFLFPPPREVVWSISRTLLKLKIWLLDIFDPLQDIDCKMERVDQMMSAHTNSLKSMQKDYRQGLWYLEVVAVHPCLQSRGIGRGVMEWVLEYNRNQPIYLECTQERNVGFYESFGFRVLEEVVLTDETSDDENATVKYWAMIRTGEDSLR